MQLKETKKELEKFAKFVIQQARSNLTKGKKNVNKKLYNSLKYKPVASSKNLKTLFIMEEYGKYQDEGVRGAFGFYADKNTTSSPYRYKSKGGKFGLKGMPPASAFKNFIKRKGIKGRDAKTGRFITNKTLQFLIARSIFEKGIRASMFFSRPFNLGLAKLPEKLQDKFGIDLENLIETDG